MCFLKETVYTTDEAPIGQDESRSLYMPRLLKSDIGTVLRIKQRVHACNNVTEMGRASDVICVMKRFVYHNVSNCWINPRLRKRWPKVGN